MVAAHLRGILRPHPAYGLRSMVTEDIVLEAMSADLHADALARQVDFSAAMLPVLTEKGIRDVVQRASKLMQRTAALKQMDIYEVSRQLSEQLRLSENNPNFSLLQLYKIAEKQGIFDDLDRHFDGVETYPLL